MKNYKKHKRKHVFFPHHHHHVHRKSHQRKKISSMWWGISLVFVVVFGFLIMNKIEKNYFADELEYLNRENDYKNQKEPMIYEGKEYKKNSKITTILMLGIDEFREEKTIEEEPLSAKPADLIVLLVINKKNETYQILSINSDTMASVMHIGEDGEEIEPKKEQISLAHTYGKTEEERCANIRNSLSSLLYGISIDDCVSFTMDAIPILNDKVGGVEVLIEDDFSAVDESLTQGNRILLKGKQALNFIHTQKQMNDRTNQARMQRQKTYMQQFLKQLDVKVKGDPTFFLNLLTDIEEYSWYSGNIDEVLELSELLSSYTREELKEIKGEAQVRDGCIEVYPEETQLKQTVLSLFYEEKDQNLTAEE